MKPRTRDLLVYVSGAGVLLVALEGVIYSLFMSHSVSYVDVDKGFSKFESCHDSAYGWLAIASIAVFLMAFYRTSKDLPIWRIRIDQKISPRRSAVLISFGLWLAVIALGASAIMYHKAYAMPENVLGTSTFDHWNEEARRRAVIGLVGAGILSYGLLFSKARDFELVEDPEYYNRPLWQCLIPMVLGFVVGISVWVWGAREYRSYAEREEEGLLNEMVIASLLIAFVLVIIGLSMMARTEPSPKLRAKLYPPASGEEKKE